MWAPRSDVETKLKGNAQLQTILQTFPYATVPVSFRMNRLNGDTAATNFTVQKLDEPKNKPSNFFVPRQCGKFEASYLP